MAASEKPIIIFMYLLNTLITQQRNAYYPNINRMLIILIFRYAAIVSIKNISIKNRDIKNEIIDTDN